MAVSKMPSLLRGCHWRLVRQCVVRLALADKPPVAPEAQKRHSLFGSGIAGAGFTLAELLVVMAILALTSGLVIMAVGSVGRSTDTQLAQAECAEIRKAALRFAADMGQPPRYVAELLQSPDPSDALGGWWWRTDGAPATALRSFDPAIGRGWNGPYLHAEFTSSGDGQAAEARLLAASTTQTAASDNAAHRRLAVLLSGYSTHPQKTVDGRLLSHYQMDYSDSGEIFVRFVHDPSASSDQTVVVARLGLGIVP
jgi:prepilin-type N-terminal cleavage/methylation domain-containing protein